VNRFRRAAAAGDEGMALVLVVGTMLILAMLATTALAYTVSGQKFARYDQDYSGAMTAAQSGVDDFISRLNRDDTYYRTIDCANVAMKAPSVPGNTCGWTTGTPVGWLPVVPGTTDPKAAYFHYSLDSSRAITEGTITLTVTGKANGRYRSVEAAVGKDGSTDYVYYTDFESADPSNVQAYPSTPSATCGGNGNANAKYWWNGREGAGCSEITFISGDTLAGAVFSNDSVLSSGATFTNGFTTANPECDSPTVTSNTNTWKYCLRNDGGSYSTANFSGIKPQYSRNGPLYLQDTSAAFATYPGCHYAGSTRIIFNANGTMTVWSKTANNGGAIPAPIAAPGAASAPTCGTASALNSAAGATVDVPDNMVIYVEDDTTGMTQSQCDAGQIGGPSGSELPLGTFTKASAAAKPTGNNQSYQYDKTMTETTKYCQVGNLYVQGVVKGRVTIASEQSTVVTGDLVLAGGLNGTDMLGLVATNSVEVFHPYMQKVSGPTNGCPSSTCKWSTSPSTVGEVAGWPVNYADPTGAVVVAGTNIMGSIQTLQHSFYVQQYNVGDAEGLLQVNGSIAQRWRGIVGTGNGSTGYYKNYVYDSRLKYAAPPYFPKWVNAQWSQHYFGEITTPLALRS
jgi:Tfp pilus assembly protein PilX